MESLADDAAAVLDELGIGRAVVGGLSMGGYAALAFARRHSERLLGLILADTRAEADSEEARRQRMILAERIRLEGSSRPALDNLPRLLSPGARPELVSTVASWIEQARPGAVVDALLGLAARPDATHDLAQIRVPTLVNGGEQDAITAPPVLTRLHRGIPGSRLVVIPAAGHLSNLEAPEAFAEAVADLLASLRPAWSPGGDPC
jgi:pimeloyl-ACP methyl ester carboxylesterase